MSKKIKALPPSEARFDRRRFRKLVVMAITEIILWFALIGAALNVFAYYIHSIFTNGFFDPESLKYAVIVAVGSYFCLIIDNDKICKALGIRKDLTLITSDQIMDKNKSHSVN